MVREIRNCLASMRTLQCVLPSPGLVFSVVSRILCSSSGVNTLPRRLRLRTPVTAWFRQLDLAPFDGLIWPHLEGV